MKNVLLWGPQAALVSAKVKGLCNALKDLGFEVKTASSPMQLKAVGPQTFDRAVLVIDSSMPPMADMWAKFFEAHKEQISFFSWTQKPVQPGFKKYFSFENSWLFDEFKDPRQLAGLIDLSTKDSGNAATSVDIPVRSIKGSGKNSEFEESVTGILNVSEPSIGDLGIQKDSDSSSYIGDLDLDSNDNRDSGEELILSQEDEHDEISQLGSLQSGGFGSGGDSIQDLGLDSIAVESDDEGHDLEDLSLNIDSSELVELPKSEDKHLSSDASQILPDSLDAIEGGGESTESFNIVKRYALLKEKENREKQKTIDILKSELARHQADSNKIHTEKRKLNLQIDDLESERRAQSETIDELRHRVNMSDSDRDEQIKDYKMRLENSRYQEKKLEKKLEDFKLRVRLDIQSIRARERELENRLDLQKRDAEALLYSKDKRLLEQKSKIDKLDFEIQTLKERLVEETEEAEERNAKLLRAVQSLKMAQGMLAGLDDDVVGAASDEESGDDAA